MEKIRFCGLSFGEILSAVDIDGFSPEHSLRISNNLYKKGISSFSEIAGIPRRIKSALDLIATPGIIPPSASEISNDGTVKYLFTSEGKKYETVYIPEGKRHTVCVSSQSGCRMGCPFCATGNYGFHGNLTVGEIVSQVAGIPEARKITHVVFMGMGEPMDNLDNVIKACEIFTAEWGMALGRKNITVSTVGIIPGIRRFLKESECNFALSLFSPFPEERKEIVPVERKYPVIEILDILRNFPLNRKRRISITYVMIEGVNDTVNHLEGLKKLAGGTGIRVNLLPYHPIPGDKYFSAGIDRMNYFRHELVTSGISASIRKSRGSDISAACGLLASEL